MSLYSVQGCPRKQIPRSSTNKALKMSLVIQERNSLILSKTCHNQTTTSWNAFLWVEFVKSVVPFLNRIRRSHRYSDTKTGSLPLEANPVKVPDNTILPDCLIHFRQVKEETHCLLPPWKGIPEIFQASPGGRPCYDVSWSHWLLSNIPDFSRYQMKQVLIMHSRTLHMHWSVQWVYNGSVWSLFGLGSGITVAAPHWWGKSAEIQILFSTFFTTQQNVSSWQQHGNR